jgi:hypothetical protein
MRNAEGRRQKAEGRQTGLCERFPDFRTMFGAVFEVSGAMFEHWLWIVVHMLGFSKFSAQPV